MKTARAALISLFLLAPTPHAAAAPCAVAVHSAFAPRVAVLSITCRPPVHSITILHNAVAVSTTTLPRELANLPGPFIFMIDLLDGLNYFTAESADNTAALNAAILLLLD